MTLKNQSSDNLYQNYKKNTQRAYDYEKTISYHRAQTEKLSWIRFTTWRQRKIIELFLKRIEKNSDITVLDVPCGTGIMTDVITKYTTNLLSIDISDDMLNIAKENYPQGEYVNLDILQLNSLNQSFDLVLTIGILHRLPQDIRNKVLYNISQITKKYIIVTFTKDYYLMRIKRIIMGIIFKNYKPAPQPIKYSTFAKEICNQGLTIIKKIAVVPFLSSEIVVLLSKKTNK